MAAGGTPSNIYLGPGRLWVAPLATAEPTSASTAMSNPWVAIGYTEKGSKLKWDRTKEAHYVAEEVDPVGYFLSKRVGTLSFIMAEMTRKRLSLALAQGAAGVDNAAYLEPSDASGETDVMFVWDSQDSASGNNLNIRYIFRQCSLSGDLEIERMKDGKTLLPVEFQLVKPNSTTQSWRVYPNANGQV